MTPGRQGVLCCSLLLLSFLFVYKKQQAYKEEERPASPAKTDPVAEMYEEEPYEEEAYEEESVTEEPKKNK